jgi:hypothetical protein
MPAPHKGVMRHHLASELRHKSEDVDDDVLLDVVRAVRRRVGIVNRKYDVPYIAGYSVDGRTVFIVATFRAASGG